MLYLFLFLAVLAIALLALQQYSLRKYKRGFSLRDDKNRPRRSLFGDPEENRMRQWLESDDEDAQGPLDDDG